MGRPRKPAPEAPLPCTIFPCGDGLYRAWVDVGFKPDGTQDRRKREGKTPEIVEAKVRALLKEIAENDGEAPAPGRKPTVEEWITTWLKTIAPYGKRPLREKSQEGYWSLCRVWIFPHIGHLRVNELKISHLDALYAAMYEAGRADTTVLKTHAVLRRALAVAQQRDLVKRNVAAIRDNPGSTKGKKRKPLTPEQAIAFLQELVRRPNGLRWKVGLAIGPRQGEALGLRWAFVDFERNTVAIDWQLQRVKYKHGCTNAAGASNAAACARKHCRTGPCPPTWEHGCTNPEACKGKPGWCPVRQPAKRCRFHRRKECPKPCRAGCKGHAQFCPDRKGGGLVFVRPKALAAATADEVASEPVSLPKSLMAELKELHDKQQVHAESIGDTWEDHDLVFCQENGKPIDHGADLGDLKEILRAAGLPQIGTHAANRHTAATLLSGLGIRAEDIQKVLRQKDIRTARGYIGDDGQATRGAAAAMEAGLFQRGSDTDVDTHRQQLRERRSQRRRRV